MVRKNSPNAQLAAWWAGLSVHEKHRLLFDLKRGLREAADVLNADRDGEYQLPPGRFNPDTSSRPKPQPGPGDEPHPPTRVGAHKHYHVHGLDSGTPGLDGNGGHAHHHAHGGSGDAADEDNDHDHVHSEADWPPDEWPSPAYERPSTASKYRQHIRFQQGQAMVMNSARRAASDAAWAQLAATAREIERRSR